MMQKISTSTMASGTSPANAESTHPIATMNCDRVAWIYQAAEYLAFGGALQSCRALYLPDLGNCSKALLCGDGDGRFLVELLRTNRGVRVDFVDFSAGMIDLARRRVNGIGSDASSRTSFHTGDIRRFEPACGGPYDLITAQFFLDCFDDGEVKNVARKLASLAQPGAYLVLSDFRIPRRGIARDIGALVVRALYGAFRLTTGLRVTRLPNYEGALEDAGFSKQKESLKLGGLLVASLWKKN